MHQEETTKIGSAKFSFQLWFLQRVAVTRQRAQARAIHARTACLKTSRLVFVFIFAIYTPPSRGYLSWGSHGDCGVFLDFLGAGCLFGTEFYGMVPNAREFPLHNYLVC